MAVKADVPPSPNLQLSLQAGSPRALSGHDQGTIRARNCHTFAEGNVQRGSHCGEQSGSSSVS